MEEITIHSEEIQLDQILKLAGAIPTGGALKPLLAEGSVFLNGAGETARRRKLHAGDVVEIRGMGRWKVAAPGVE